MGIEDMENIIKSCDKFLNRYLLQGKKFINYACFPTGACNYMISGAIDSEYIDDFQYFVFTKSTKSLHCIRLLLRDGKMEDALIILRSIFESYLSSRFLFDNYQREMLNDFLFTPMFIGSRKIIFDGKRAKDRDSQEFVSYKQRNPSEMKEGKDKTYFSDFYKYLCNFSHCNYSIISCYQEKNGIYTCEKETNKLLVRVFVLFVYTKIFESIVTVQGEDFPDERTKINCYKLVKDTNLFLDKQFELLSNYNSDISEELDKHMRKMFKNMRKSLKEELGSLEKNFFDQGKN